MAPAERPEAMESLAVYKSRLLLMYNTAQCHGLVLVDGHQQYRPVCLQRESPTSFVVTDVIPL